MSSSPVSYNSGKNPFFSGNAFVTRSPFEDADESDVVSATAPEGSYTYAMIPSGAVEASEVESASSVVEVSVKWEQSVLHVAHVEGKSFSVGEDGADYEMPIEKLGASKLELVSFEGGAAKVLVPADATGRVQESGKSSVSFADATEAGMFSITPAGRQLTLAKGSKVTMQLGGFTFEIAAVMGGKKIAGRGKMDRRALGFAALSGLAHAGVFAAMFAFMPALQSSDDGQISEDQQAMLAMTFKTIAEAERQETKEAAEEQGSSAPGETGQRATGEEGKKGSETSKAQNHAFALKGDSKDRTMSRAAALDDASHSAMIGLINTASGDPNHAFFGDVAMGSDPFSANGNMWGPDLGEAAGNGGLGLSGVGEGGGSKGFGVGMGDIGTIARGMGNCSDGPCTGFGRTGGIIGAGHHTGSPKMRPDGETKVGGRLPSEVIQRIVRQNFGRFRMCYESGLKANPNLQGRVSVRFVIGSDGSVGSTSNGGSDLPDSGVVSCVVRAFGGLSFPQPDNGIVTVTYPIMFTPGS